MKQVQRQLRRIGRIIDESGMKPEVLDVSLDEMKQLQSELDVTRQERSDFAGLPQWPDNKIELFGVRFVVFDEPKAP